MIKIIRIRITRKKLLTVGVPTLERHLDIGVWFFFPLPPAPPQHFVCQHGAAEGGFNWIVPIGTQIRCKKMSFYIHPNFNKEDIYIGHIVSEL